MNKLNSLEKLERIKNGKFITCDLCDENWHKGCSCCQRTLKECKDFDDIEKDLKAFEIIKPYVSVCVQQMTTNCYYYLVITKSPYEITYIKITKEQFDLLKEVLKNGK